MNSLDKSVKQQPREWFSFRLAALASSGIVLRLSGLAYAFAKPKFMAPADLGLWNLLALIPNYAGYLHLGSRETLVYCIPRLIGGGGQDQQIDDSKSTVFWFTFFTNGSLSLILVFIAFFFSSEQKIYYGLFTTAVYLMISWYNVYQLTMLKAYQRFDIITRARFIDALTALLVCIPLVAALQIYGVFIGALLSGIIPGLYMAFRYPIRIERHFKPALLWEMIQEGFPIMIYNFALVILTTSDRLIIGSLLSLKDLGYYGVASVLAGFILQIPMSARDMLEPQLMTRVAGEDSDNLWRTYFYDPLINTAVLFPLIWGPTAFLAEEALMVLLPNYIGSVVAMVFLAHGVFFLALTTVIRGIVVAMRLQTLSLIPLGIGLILNIAINYGVITQGFGISGVALGSGVSFAIVFYSIFTLVWRRSPLSIREGWRILTLVTIPLIYSILAISLINRAFVEISIPHQLTAIIKLTLYMLGAAVLIIVTRWRTGIIDRLFR